jgi:hypothetical protein
MPVDNTTSSETELLLRDDRFTANNRHTSCSSVVPQSSDNGYIKSKDSGRKMVTMHKSQHRITACFRNESQERKPHHHHNGHPPNRLFRIDLQSNTNAP